MVIGNSRVTKVKGWELSTKDDLFVFRSFPRGKTDDMELYIKHCVKSVRIGSFCGPYFAAFSPNEGKYRAENLRIRTLFMQWCPH